MLTDLDDSQPSLGLLGDTDIIGWHLPCQAPLYIHFIPGGVEFYEVNPQFFPLGDTLTTCPHCNKLILVKDIGSAQTFADRLGLVIDPLVNHETESDCLKLVEELLAIASHAGVPRYYVDTLRSSHILLMKAAQDLEHAYRRVLSQVTMKTEVHRSQRARFNPV